MKLKVKKEKHSAILALKSIFFNMDTTTQCLVSVDVDGGIILENFKKIRDYNNTGIVLETKEKIVYIYGEDIKITFTGKRTAVAAGQITKIEMFEMEV